MLVVLTYVDELLFTGNDFKLLANLVSALHTLFPLKDLKDLHFFLGIEAHKTISALCFS